MAASKKRTIKQGGTPQGHSFGTVTPERVRNEHISWSFSDCDTSPDIRWGFNKENLSEAFWDLLLPKMKDLETMTLNEIFVKASKQNHEIDVTAISSKAASRLEELRIEAEALHSIRLNGKTRLYGVLVGSVFNIIWYDQYHGDNDDCVCRSKKKHT